jgi:hypothetical protein
MQWLVYIEVRPELTNDEIMGGVTDSVDFEAQTYTRTYESAVKPPPGVPRSVSPSQFRRALNAANLRSAVEAAISAADQGTKDLWEYATSVDRDNVQLNAMATVLGITQNQLDDIFIAASQI